MNDNESSLIYYLFAVFIILFCLASAIAMAVAIGLLFV